MVIGGDPQAAALDGARLAARLCLDFANTAGWHASETPVESLADYHKLLVWARRHGVVDDVQAEALAKRAERSPDRAARALAGAVDLREAIYRAFRDVAHGGAAAPQDLAVLNRFLAEAMSHVGLVATEHGYKWEWEEAVEMEAVLWPIARAAADLLTSPLLSRVRECAGHPCGWLFLDESRNRSRRWCDMSDCGNRAKARRHYQRVREARESGGPG